MMGECRACGESGFKNASSLERHTRYYCKNTRKRVQTALEQLKARKRARFEVEPQISGISVDIDVLEVRVSVQPFICRLTNEYRHHLPCSLLTLW
jgi:hypothetical protein